MRQMFDEGMVTKQQIIEGEVGNQSRVCSAYRPGDGTEKVARPEYASFAKACEQAADDLETADVSQRVNAYQSLVATCMNCHQAMCPGPMVKIKKLYLSEQEMAELR
jgi:hypothetical protein